MTRIIRHLMGSLALVLLLVLGTVLLMPGQARAATEDSCNNAGDSIPIVPTWYEYLPRSFNARTGSCEVAAAFPDAIPQILLAIFEIMLRITGMLAVIFVTYGGFQYLISTGEPDKTKAARTTIMNALVGLLIAMFATVIVNLIARNI